ncbi:MAG: RHS repeat-associated core domain-containing protein, partial [Dokdonella sp.]
YLAYGGLHASTGTGNQVGPGYANQYADSTGLIYMHARYYDTQLHRFISVDPNPVSTDNALNFNRYAYASNSPYAKYDPSGRESNCVLKHSCAGQNPSNPDLSGLTSFFESDAFGQLAADAGMAMVIAMAPGGGNISEDVTEAEVAQQASVNSKTYTTYTRAKAADETVYSGRTSGYGTPEEQVVARTSSRDHEAKTDEGYGAAVVDQNSANASAIRGREQQLIEQNGGAQSVGGTSGNKINGVSPANQNAEVYQLACDDEFGCF